MSPFWKFVFDNSAQAPAALRLKYHGKTAGGIDYALAITQIECRQKFGKKLAETLAANPCFLFPSVLAGEQATSDAIAAEHARLIAEGASVADLTAGLGIDAMHLARKAREVVAVERDQERYDALVANAADMPRIQPVLADCREYIATAEAVDAVFVDPARRAADGSRVFALADCEPDVTAMLPMLQEKCNMLIVKMSPMLDISRTADELPHARAFEALGTTTECKELVAIAQMQEPRADGDYDIRAITLLPGGGRSEFAFTPAQEREAVGECQFAAPQPGMMLYEPYPAVMKAGPFYLLAKRFGMKKIAPNTHLYLNDGPVEGFPGVGMAIEKVVTYESKHIKRLHREYPAISVTTRNFDVAADALRKKLGVRDGGDRRLFAVTAASGAKLMLICK